MKQETTKREKQWIAKKDLLLYLKISQRTLENHVNNGFIPAYRLGGKVFFDLNEVDEIISINRRK